MIQLVLSRTWNSFGGDKYTKNYQECAPGWNQERENDLSELAFGAA